MVAFLVVILKHVFEVVLVFCLQKRQLSRTFHVIFIDEYIACIT